MFKDKATFFDSFYSIGLIVAGVGLILITFLLTIPPGRLKPARQVGLPQIEGLTTSNTPYAYTINFDYLKENIIFHGPTDQKLLALTFDADMTPGMKNRLSKGEVKSWYNQNVIDVLKQTKTPATLFLSGLWIETYPEISKQLSQEPLFELGSHSYSHPAFARPCFGLTPISDLQKTAEITKTQTLLKNLTGKNTFFFRFPGGCYTKKDLALAKSLGVLPIQWNSDGPDAFNTNTKEIVKNLERLTTNGAIIILHMHGGANAPMTSEVLKQYIPYARSKGFTFVKLSELLK
ncbi:MAG TPA: polysaccharide deacetylase family protein [Patescibacteria group bacterium]